MDEKIRPNARSLVGIFGGTFDPPHVGHLILAEEAIYQLGLSKVIWVITPHPPHKTRQLISDIRIRTELVRAAIRSNPAFEFSNVDISRSAPHYAVDTLYILKQSYPEAGLVYLLGGDSLHDLPGWHTPDKLLEACQMIGVMRRPGDQVDIVDLVNKLPSLAEKLAWIDTPGLEISASLVRQKIRQRQAYQYYLHPDVYKLIQDKELYS